MKSKTEINNLIGSARERIDNSLAVLIKNRKLNLDVDIKQAVTNIDEFLTAIINVIKGEDYYIEEVNLPGVLKSWRYFEQDGKILHMDLTVRTKLGVDPVVKVTERFYTDDEDFVVKIANLISSTVLTILINDLAKKNIEEFNLELGVIISESGFRPNFDFAFVLSDKTIVDINDEEVILGVSAEKAFEIGDLSIFGDSSEYLEYCTQVARDSFIESLKGVQTPVHLLKASIEVLDDLCGLKTKKRVDSLLRGVYHKQAKCLNGTKVGIGYVSEKVTVDGEEKNIFALVKKQDDNLEVVLSPFDVKTLTKVDIDVLTLLG